MTSKLTDEDQSSICTQRRIFIAATSEVISLQKASELYPRGKSDFKPSRTFLSRPCRAMHVDGEEERRCPQIISEWWKPGLHFVQPTEHDPDSLELLKTDIILQYIVWHHGLGLRPLMSQGKFKLWVRIQPYHPHHSLIDISSSPSASLAVLRERQSHPCA